MRDTESPERIRALMALYRATHYEVIMPGGDVATLRIGAAAPLALRKWIDKEPCAGFITACNPRSQVLSQPENERRLAAMRERLRLRSCRLLEGVGHIPGGRWREPSLLVSGIDLATLDRLASEFAQNAIVVATASGIPRLRLYRAEWRDVVDDDANLEWGSS